MREENKQPAGQKTAEVEKKKRFPVKLIVLFIAGLFLCGGGIYAWKGGLLTRVLGGGEVALAAKEAEKPLAPGIGPIYSMDTFIVNLVDPLGKRYLKLKMELELDGALVREEVTGRMPQLKDTVITLLSSKGFEDVSSLEGKLQLRAEMISLLNQHLLSGAIKNIYFTEFIVQ